jgi:hypothetical protein
MREPWNSSGTLARLRARPPSLRGGIFRYYDGYDVSVSPDGRLLALALPGKPQNEIDIVDVATGDAWVLRHPEPLLLLSYPTFAPTGDLAVVVSPPSWYAVSEVWITDAHGKPAQVFGAEGTPRAYRKPSFSADGSKILCMRELINPAVPPTYVAREFRSFLFFALFEIDRQTKAETQVHSFASDQYNRFYYGADPNVILGNMTLPFTPDGPLNWYAPPPDNGFGAFRCFAWDRRQPFPNTPEFLEVARHLTTRPGFIHDDHLHLCDVAADGSALVEAFYEPDPTVFGAYRRFLFSENASQEIVYSGWRPPMQASLGSLSKTVVELVYRDIRTSLVDGLSNLLLKVSHADGTSKLIGFADVRWNQFAKNLDTVGVTRLNS